MAKSVNLTALYTELKQQEQNGEYDRGLRTANKILQAAQDDNTAFHCKIVCLIQLGKFPEALKHMNNFTTLSEALHFEKAYCLYRLNRTTESLNVLQPVKDPDLRTRELLGQVLYRKEAYDEAFSIYKDLTKHTQDDYEEERTTNLTAVMAALQLWDNQSVQDVGIEQDTYELCYNAACGLIGQGQYEKALKKLHKAEELCRQQFEEDPEIGEEEIEAELGDIRVQMGYTLQQLGRVDEALKQYNTVIKSRPTDTALAAVVSNNIITINKDQNVFDSQKRIKALQAEGLQQKLTRLQRQALALNQSMFYLLQNKGELCRKSLQTLREEEADSDLPAMVEAALYSKEKEYELAINTLKAEAEKSDTLPLHLALAQLHLSQGQVYKACEVLTNIGPDSFRLGVVSAVVMLYMSQEDASAASEVLENTVKWHQENKPDSSDLLLLMRANANFQIQRGNTPAAIRMLEDLRKHNPGDLKTLAQLIAAYSKTDSKKAHLMSRELPLPKDLSREIDVDSLESSANLGPKYIKRTAKIEMSPTAVSPQKEKETTIQKKKKKKKVKLPKDCDLNAPVDQERWLPLRERSTYRGKRKKKGTVGKGTQGAMSSAVANEFDKSAGASGASAGDKSEPGTSPMSPKDGGASGPRQQKPQSGKAQRRKKKGGKW